jgi:DNA-directed RNA polymerase specialized sigma24 family protein
VNDFEMERGHKIIQGGKSPGSSSARQKWALTREAFDALLASLDFDSELAGEKYLLLRRNLVRFFEGRGCRFAEDHADEAINRVAKRIHEGEQVRDINGYCFGVARLFLLEVFKETEREAKAFTELSSNRALPSDDKEAEVEANRLECLTQCLNKLPADSRELILQYYTGERSSRIENRKRLGQKLGIPNQALRSRAVRLREKIETCILTCIERGTSKRYESDTTATKRREGFPRPAES